MAKIPTGAVKSLPKSTTTASTDKSTTKPKPAPTPSVILQGQTKAFANNDLALVFWKFNQKIPNCLGYCIERVDAKSKVTTVLPAWVGFQGQTNTAWKASDTAHLPIQKMSWLDVSAPRGGNVFYVITPMIGTPTSLVKTTDKTLILTTNTVTFAPDAWQDKYFNPKFPSAMDSLLWA